VALEWVHAVSRRHYSGTVGDPVPVQIRLVVGIAAIGGGRVGIGVAATRANLAGTASR
jgi:hypothetical protein